MSVFDLKGLAALLQESNPDHESDSDSDDNGARASKMGPGNIITAKKATDSSAKGVLANRAKKAVKDTNAIWSPNEILVEENGEVLYPDVSSDPRETPKYEIYFQQRVTPEDMFLQMGNKTACTSSCETMCVDILMPEEVDFSNIQLDVKFQSVEIRSPKYILILPLPHKINPRAGKAKWHADSKKLVLSLVLNRELDDFNF